MSKPVNVNGLWVIEVEQTETGTYYRGLDRNDRGENHLIQCEECQFQEAVKNI